MSNAETVRMIIDAYGIGVRAGVITPCLSDEQSFRKMLSLPPAPKEVEEDWAATKGVRKPITIQQEANDSTAVAQGNGNE